MEEFTVVRCLAKDRPTWGLTENKLYAVEIDEIYVTLFKSGTITVWNDTGNLAELKKNEYEFVTVGETEWFRSRPNSVYVEEF